MKLAVIAPSSPVLEPSEIDRGVGQLLQLGFEVELAPHVTDVYGRLAGKDEDRATDFLDTLERRDLDGVICLRGGYGAIRTALALDQSRLRSLSTLRPKVFVGHSDITLLHGLLERFAGWVTFYGPMIISFAQLTDYTRDAFKAATMSSDGFDVPPDPDDPYVQTIVPGSVEGILAGGCLTMLDTLVGTPWEPDLADKIVFFEDVNCDPHRVERMIARLIATGRLSSCRGIVVGEHFGCVPQSTGPTLGLEQIFHDLLTPLGVPVLYHLPIGHGRHIATLPFGVLARLDATNRRLQILESGVC
jgi:muramoyltetrapeptide carboxypeptidase